MDKRFNKQEQRVVIKTFEDPGLPGRGIEVNGFVGRPLTWSLNFANALPDNRVGHFLRPNVRVTNALAVADMVGMRFARLIDEATLFIKEEAQAEADAYIERKQYRELREADRGQHTKDTKPSPLGAALTPEQRQAKKHRHEQNLSARRAADAAFRQSARGK